MTEYNSNEGTRRPRPGEFYQHFKHKLYQILTIAKHTETGEELVIYQALYDDFQVFARPLSSFISEVDSVKYPQAEQKYRFELWKNREEYKEKVEVPLQTKEPQENKKDLESEKRSLLMEFLDAKTCKEKLEIFERLEKYKDEHILNSMAVSLDLAILEEEYESRKEGIRDYLLARIRFESSRLR